MENADNKELNALIRMMIYLKHELIRNDLVDESDYIESALNSLQEKLDIFEVNTDHNID